MDEANLRFQVGCLRRALRGGQPGARHVINIAGRGYCFVSPVTRAPISSRAPDRSRPAGAASKLPPRLNRMVGRDAEVAALAAEVRSRRFVTILGPGGIGKTTVAVAVGHALAAEYSGVGFVDLARQNSFDRVRRVVLARTLRHAAA